MTMTIHQTLPDVWLVFAAEKLGLRMLGMK